MKNGRLSYSVRHLRYLCLHGIGGLPVGVGHELVEKEDQADVGSDVQHVGAEALVEPTVALFPVEKRFTPLWDTHLLRIQCVHMENTTERGDGEDG